MHNVPVWLPHFGTGFPTGAKDLIRTIEKQLSPIEQFNLTTYIGTSQSKLINASLQN